MKLRELLIRGGRGGGDGYEGGDGKVIGRKIRRKRPPVKREMKRI